MTSERSIIWLYAVLISGGLAYAAPLQMPIGKVSMETCLEAAQAKLNGEPVKLEFKTERGIPVYEIEITRDGRHFEFECNGNTGAIIEHEQEVANADVPQFRDKAKISLEKAREIVLKAHPGKIVETEFEIESSGDASYEFDIRQDDGQEVKIEVDAATGKIVEDDEHEIYQIGRE